MLKLIDNAQIKRADDGVLVAFEGNPVAVSHAYERFRGGKDTDAGVYGMIVKKEEFRGQEVCFAVCPHYDGNTHFWLSLPKTLVKNVSGDPLTIGLHGQHQRPPIRVPRGEESVMLAGTDKWIGLKEGAIVAAVTLEKERLLEEIKQLALGTLVNTRTLDTTEATKAGYKPHHPVHREAGNTQRGT